MRHKVAIIFVSLLSLVSIASGLARRPHTAIADTVKLQLIRPVKQNIQVNCAGIDRKFYFIDEIQLTKQDILNNYTCFILNNEFVISEAVIPNVDTQLKLYRNVLNNDFQPEIGRSAFETIAKKCKIYQLVIRDTMHLSDQVSIKLKYHIPEHDTVFTIQSGKDWMDFKGSEFWYPRNVNLNEDISLYVKTADNNSFYLNGKPVEYKQNKYLKEYNTSFVDMADSPAVLMFRKTGLK